MDNSMYDRKTKLDNILQGWDGDEAKTQKTAQDQENGQPVKGEPNTT